MRELAAAVESVRPLVDVLEHPVRVASSKSSQWLLDRVTARLGAPSFALTAPDRLRPFERVVSDRLGLDRFWPVDRGLDVEAEVDRGRGQLCERVVVSSWDGEPIPAYAAGDPAAPAVVIASACGMPVRLAEPWIRGLSASYRVLTWESRGLFAENFAGATDVAAQVRDMVAVMDHFGVPVAHVVGLCGGAVLALVAAREHADRVSSLSLWHGDFELGDMVPKTDHQRDLQALMAMAARSRDSARGIQATLSRTMLAGTPPGLAHLVLYPYATPELLYRYCRLNGAIMSMDVRPMLDGVVQQALVVTSEDDHTAHPAGSRHVADRLARGRLHVTAHGDHLSVFEGTTVLAVAMDFLTAQRSVPGRAHS